MIILISGKDSFRSRQRLKQLIAAFQKKFDPRGYNVARYSGKLLSLAALQGALGTQSLLGSKRMVVIEGLLGTKLAEAAKQVLAYLHDHDTNDCITILYEQVTIPKTTEKNPALKKATHEIFEELEGPALAKFIAALAKEKKIQLNPMASRMLAERVGSDTWMLATTLDQLAAYSKGKPVTEKDVALFTNTSYDENIFHFTDALGKKDMKTALQLLYDQLQLGSHPLYILTMLVRQFRLLLLVSQDAGELPGVHPFVVQKSRQQARLFRPSVLRQAFRDLIQIDAELKGGFQDAETLLTRFIIRTSAA